MEEVVLLVKGGKRDRNVRMKEKPKNGFALVDVLLAVLVLAIGVGYLTSLMTSSARQTGAATNLTHASYLVERVKDDLKFPGSGARLNSEGTARGTEKIQAIDYSWTARRESSEAGVDQVQINVTWKDFSGSHSHVFVTSIRSR